MTSLVTNVFGLRKLEKLFVGCTSHTRPRYTVQLVGERIVPLITKA